MLREITWVADFWVSLRTGVTEVMAANHFPANRVDPSFVSEDRFPRLMKRTYPLTAKRTHVPGGHEVADIPLFMREIRAKEPTDIREIIAIGKSVEGMSFTYHIFAPTLTGDARRFIELTTLSMEPGFGLGILPPFHHEDVEHGGLSLCDHNFLWFIPE